MGTVVVVVVVAAEIDVGKARRAAVAMCDQENFGRVETGAVAISVSELAQNLWVHAGGGTITLTMEHDERGVSLEVQAKDQGPGILDIERALQDGYSTAGGMGSGLPGVQRLMDEFEIQSKPGEGTLIVARKWAQKRG